MFPIDTYITSMHNLHLLADLEEERSQMWPTEWYVSLPGIPAMVPVARRLARAALHGNPVSDDALLVITELVTNSVKYASAGGATTRVTLGFVLRPGRLRIEVGDLGRADWVERHQPGEREYGHGLDIVKAIADQAGHAPTAAGHLSWAELCWSELPPGCTSGTAHGRSLSHCRP
jgi:anti-sigma regulatory factor (Ser/Thr protein kinase)